MQEQLNVTKQEAIALGRGIEREGFIHHVTYRYNFADANNLFFRFTVRASILQPTNTSRLIENVHRRMMTQSVGPDTKEK